MKRRRLYRYPFDSTTCAVIDVTEEKTISYLDTKYGKLYMAAGRYSFSHKNGYATLREAKEEARGILLEKAKRLLAMAKEIREDI